MRVRRGREDDPETDESLTRELLLDAEASDEPHLRVWRPPPHCSFGRRDARAEGYERARELATDRGFPPMERDTGGRPTLLTGSTVAVALATPVDAERTGIRDRYETVLGPVQRALWRLGVPAQRGEPADSFCPGSHSLQWRGKVAGFAQRVNRQVALVSGVVLVRDHEVVGEVLEPVYDALDLPFDPEAVGSVARAEGRADPVAVTRAIESAIVGDRSPAVERVGDLEPTIPSEQTDRED